LRADWGSFPDALITRLTFYGRMKVMTDGHRLQNGGLTAAGLSKKGEDSI
jgi:hypothetical protein